MSSLKHSLLALATLCALPASGCELAVFPETATYTGGEAARAAVAIGATQDGEAMSMDAFEVEVVEVLLHRPADDTWLLLSPESARLELTQPERDFAYTDIPLGADVYDEIVVVVDEVHVAKDGDWHALDFEDDEIHIPGEWIIDRDVVLDIRLDLEASLVGDADVGYRFEPSAQAQVWER